MATKYSPKIITNGLVLSLDAANNKSYPRSGTTWTDLSGNNNTGTLTNGPTFNAGNQGSISFDGTDDYIDTVNTGTTFQFSNTTFTLSLWVKTNAVSGNLISKGATASTGGWVVGLSSNGTFNTTTKFSDGFNVATRSSVSSINDNNWYNIVIIITTNTSTQSSNNLLLYLNGILNQSSLTLSNVYAATTDTIQIGRRPSGGYFSGNISNVQIYNRELTAAEVLQNYNATKSRFGR
jgi:hypothetical protein